jgi:hypothetical protein
MSACPTCLGKVYLSKLIDRNKLGIITLDILDKRTLYPVHHPSGLCRVFLCCVGGFHVNRVMPYVMGVGC